MPASSLIEEKLRKSSRELLDLTSRNRLINTPRTRSKSTSIEVIGADANEIYARLVRDKKSMTFAGGQDEGVDDKEETEDATYHLDQPEDDDSLVPVSSRQRRPDALPTRLSSEVLQKRLLRLFYDSRTYVEEQGVNILFLAVGFLKWYEAPNSEQPRYAPLLLVPVKLERQSSRSKFKITALEDDISTNLSLKKRLEEFGVALPDVPEVDDDELSPADYFEQVRKAVAGQARWELLPNDVVLWFFSFTKFLMYRDLQPENWPADQTLSDHGPVSSLLGEGFRAEPPLCGDDDPIEIICPPEQATHIVDADSSQELAIEEVRRGRHLVIQGPPGTGKSQTIANLIANAVKDGKKVLFVAEKIAALEVVKGRLDRCGLSSLCLELHSNKANKKAVLSNLAETLDLRRPKVGDFEDHLEELRLTRERLNQHAETLHTPFGAAKYSPYFVIGQMVRLTAKGVSPSRFRLASAKQWTDRQIKDKAAIVHDLSLHLGKVGVPEQHCWRGVNVGVLLPTERQRIIDRVSSLAARLERLLAPTFELAKLLSYQLFPSASQISSLARLGRHLSSAPAADRAALADQVWEKKRSDINSLIGQGEKYADCHRRLAGVVEVDAWEMNIGPARKQLSLRGRSWFRWLSRGYRDAVKTLETICVERPPIDLQERLELLDVLLAAQRARQEIEDDDLKRCLGKCAFGSHWTGIDSDWQTLRRIQTWVAQGEEKKLPSMYRQLLGSLTDPTRCANLIEHIAAEFKPALAELTSVFQELSLDLTEAFGSGELNSISLTLIKERIDQWLQAPNALETWMAYRIRWRKLQAEQLEELAKLVETGAVPAASVVDQFYMATYEEIMRAMYREFPSLAEFNGQSHAEIVSRFQQLDMQRIELARREVALVHYRSLPRGDSDIGEMGVVRHEIQKKSRHLPIRSLVSSSPLKFCSG